MKGKPVILRERAVADIDEAIAHYAAAGGEQVALGFIDSLEVALGSVARHPAGGSPRYGNELALPGLRSKPLQHYPYLLFYLERVDHVDVWRVLHAERDLPERLRD